MKIGKNILKEKANVDLDDREIIAAHRIPEKKFNPGPLLIKS